MDHLIIGKSIDPQSLFQNEKDEESINHQIMSSNEKVQKRRKKKNIGNNDKRIYSCGCGKSYLSYPALYTHLKQKHNSNIPEGTQFPNTLGKGKKGRPKNSDKIQLSNFDDTYTDLSEESIDPLSEIVYYLKGKTLKKEESFTITNQETKYDLIKCFPMKLFKNNIEDFLPIYNNLKIMLEKIDEQNNQNYFLKQDLNINIKSLGDNHNEYYNFLKNSNKITCNKIFAQFLIQISQFVSKEIYHELCIFVCLYRKIINKYGWQIKEQFNEKNQEIDYLLPDEQNKEFCEENDAEIVPSLCNHFVKESLQSLETLFKDQEFILLGNYKNKDSNANLLYLTNHFMNWLYCKGYTSQNANFNSQVFKN